MASLVYFFKYFLGNEAGVAQFMFWGTVGNIAGVLATGWMTKYLGKKNLYMVSMLFNVVTTAAYFFAGSGDMVFLYAMNIIGGFASGPVSPLIWALYADTADYSEWKTGRRATGLIFSAGTFAQKMGWTVGGSLAAYLLAFYGFQANVVQTKGSLLGIRLLVSWIPAVAALMAIGAIAFYGITEKLQNQISSDLVARRAKEAALPTGA